MNDDGFAAVVDGGREGWDDAPSPPARVPSAPSPLDRMVGRSAPMAAVRDKLRRFARSEACVLVQGASGTGKELAARIVHELSQRSVGPFVAVDCGALAEGVLESELFGHARGAFTGAAGERRGLFEEANGGTVFLDEITNTSPSFQSRLLRVLQEREVRRVGCNRARGVDVRVIAASNRELAAEVAAGRFREDLMYRLDVLSVRMPSLAERRDDVALLAHHVLAELSRRDGDDYRLTPRALTALLGHSWPGNVRELRNVLERAVAFSADGVVDVDHLPERLSRLPVRRGLRPTLAALRLDFERCVLLERLEANGWNRTRTAQELGITRRCLFSKTRQLGLRPA